MSGKLQLETADGVRTGGLRPVTGDTTWLIEQEGFDASREGELETIFAIGNGYLGIRGALVDPLPGSQADLFVAGIYAPKTVAFPYAEVEMKTGHRARGNFVELAPFPFPFRIALKVGGRAIDFDEVEIVAFDRVLDMRRGALHQALRFRDSSGLETTLRASLCASLADVHLLLQEVQVAAENHRQPIEIEWGILGRDFALENPHLQRVDAGHYADLELFRTTGSEYLVAMGMRASMGDVDLPGASAILATSDGKPGRWRRMVAVYTSRDVRHPEVEARTALAKRCWSEFDHLWSMHERAWRDFWRDADIKFVGANEVAQGQRFNSFQLRIAADHDDRVSVGARGLTGRAYEGHVFWDTEIFAWPFYLCTQPDIARHQLMYRYLTLDGARRRAKAMGMEGACYAWESSVTGDDVTPHALVIAGTETVVPVFTGERQIHVTADVAHAVTQYWRVTRDRSFLLHYGAEILFETAQFWTSRVVERDGQYHIDQVIGPDEYHIGVNDDAFTNWMARENLRNALAVHAMLERDAAQRGGVIRETIGLAAAAPDHWREVASRLYVPQPNDAGVIEQCEGFFDLKPTPAYGKEVRLANALSLFDWREINQTRVCKQADVLMIPFLFPNALSAAVVRANYDYYEPITSHASSLSPPVHAGIAARLGLTESARRYWREALFIDLFNHLGNTALGFHVACAGGAWQAFVFHMLGVELGEDGLYLDMHAPRVLPRDCCGVVVTLQYRGAQHTFDLSKAKEQ